MGYRPNVGLMLLDPAGRVFVGRRIDTRGAWQMPQGGIDHGEAPAEAALRELEEEIGTNHADILLTSDRWLTYDFPDDLKRRAFKGHWRGQAQRWLALVFKGRDADIRIDTTHPEFDAWRWVQRAELPALIVPFKRPVYEAVLAEFEPALKSLGY